MIPTGTKMYLGYSRKCLAFDRLNVIGFYKKNVLAHPNIGEISKTLYPCKNFACFGSCDFCENKSGFTHATILNCTDIVRWLEVPKLCCTQKYTEIASKKVLTLENPRVEKIFTPHTTFLYRSGPVPNTGLGNRNYHTFRGRKSVFGSYKKSLQTAFDYTDEEEVIFFKNVRQKKTYVECGMDAWERRWARRSKCSWKRVKHAEKSWMKHVKK